MANFNAGFVVTADSSSFEKGMARVTRTAQDAGKSVARAFDGKAIAGALMAALGFSLAGLMDQVAKKIARLWIGFSEEAEAALEAQVAATAKATEEQKKALEELAVIKRKERQAEMDERKLCRLRCTRSC